MSLTSLRETTRREALLAGLICLALAGLLAAAAMADDAPATGGAPQAGPSAATTQTLVVTLPGRKAAAGQAVTLGDVAALKGPKDLVARAAAIDLGRAPLPGNSRTISRGYLKIRLRAVGVEDSDFSFDGADRVELFAPATDPAARATPKAADASGAAPSPAAPPIIHRGDTILLRVCFGLVEVRTEAIAMEDGRLGDMIRVQVASGWQRVIARVTGPRTAEVTEE